MSWAKWYRNITPLEAGRRPVANLGGGGLWRAGCTGAPGVGAGWWDCFTLGLESAPLTGASAFVVSVQVVTEIKVFTWGYLHCSLCPLDPQKDAPSNLTAARAWAAEGAETELVRDAQVGESPRVFTATLQQEACLQDRCDTVSQPHLMVILCCPVVMWRSNTQGFKQQLKLKKQDLQQVRFSYREKNTQFNDTTCLRCYSFIKGTVGLPDTKSSRARGQPWNAQHLP